MLRWTDLFVCSGNVDWWWFVSTGPRKARRELRHQSRIQGIQQRIPAAQRNQPRSHQVLSVQGRSANRGGPPARSSHHRTEYSHQTELNHYYIIPLLLLTAGNLESHTLNIFSVENTCLGTVLMFAAFCAYTRVILNFMIHHKYYKLLFLNVCLLAILYFLYYYYTFCISVVDSHLQLKTINVYLPICIKCFRYCIFFVFII